jgi:hypothetical protein
VVHLIFNAFSLRNIQFFQHRHQLVSALTIAFKYFHFYIFFTIMTVSLSKKYRGIFIVENEKSGSHDLEADPKRGWGGYDFNKLVPHPDDKLKAGWVKKGGDPDFWFGKCSIIN